MPPISASSPWWLIGIFVICSFFPVVVGILRFFTDRKKGKLSDNQQITADRIVVSNDQRLLFDQMRDQIRWQANYIKELEADRDRGWDLARAWREMYQTIRSDFHAWWISDNMGKKFTYPETPGLEEIKPKPYRS